MGFNNSAMNLFIDPGVYCVGWAQFNRQQLIICGLFQVEGLAVAESARVFQQQGYLLWGSQIFHWVVVEKPIIYPRNRKNGTKNPNDLIDITLVAGSFLGRGVQARAITPAEWKGQRPKPVVRTHIEGILTGTELSILKNELSMIPKKLQHNVWDAVGIGLWFEKRLFRGGRA